MPVQVLEPAQSVLAAFNDTERADAKPSMYMYGPPVGAAGRRTLRDSKVQDFYDAAEVRRVYDDPTAPDGRLPRESIEVRALVFFRSGT